jgi:hypothetical protein
MNDEKRIVVSNPAQTAFAVARDARNFITRAVDKAVNTGRMHPDTARALQALDNMALACETLATNFHPIPSTEHDDADTVRKSKRSNVPKGFKTLGLIIAPQDDGDEHTAGEVGGSDHRQYHPQDSNSDAIHNRPVRSSGRKSGARQHGAGHGYTKNMNAQEIINRHFQNYPQDVKLSAERVVERIRETAGRKVGKSTVGEIQKVLRADIR